MNQIGGNLGPRRQGCLQVGTRGHFAVTVFSLLTVMAGDVGEYLCPNSSN